MSELEAIRERHHPGVSPVGGRYDVCDYCGGMWPCDTAVALAEVERLRGVVEAARPRDRAHGAAVRDAATGRSGPPMTALLRGIGYLALTVALLWLALAIGAWLARGRP